MRDPLSYRWARREAMKWYYRARLPLPQEWRLAGHNARKQPFFNHHIRRALTSSNPPVIECLTKDGRWEKYPDHWTTFMGQFPFRLTGLRGSASGRPGPR